MHILHAIIAGNQDGFQFHFITAISFQHCHNKMYWLSFKLCLASNIISINEITIKGIPSLYLQTRFSTMPTSIGMLEPPLGNTRLQTARLVSALVLTNSHSVIVELGNLGTLNILLVSIVLNNDFTFKLK